MRMETPWALSVRRHRAARIPRDASVLLVHRAKRFESSERLVGEGRLVERACAVEGGEHRGTVAQEDLQPRISEAAIGRWPLEACDVTPVDAMGSQDVPVTTLTEISPDLLTEIPHL